MNKTMRDISRDCYSFLEDIGIGVKNRDSLLLYKENGLSFGVSLDLKRYAEDLFEGRIFFFVIWEPYERLLRKGFKEKSSNANTFTFSLFSFSEEGIFFSRDTSDFSNVGNLIKREMSGMVGQLGIMVRSRSSYVEGNTGGFGCPEKLVLFDFLTSGKLVAEETYLKIFDECDSFLKPRLAAFWEVISRNN